MTTASAHDPSATGTGYLLSTSPVASLSDYEAFGGGRGLTAALARSPEAVIDEVIRSGLRGAAVLGSPPG